MSGTEWGLAIALGVSMAVNVLSWLAIENVQHSVQEFRRRGRLNRILYAELQAADAELANMHKER